MKLQRLPRIHIHKYNEKSPGRGLVPALVKARMVQKSDAHPVAEPYLQTIVPRVMLDVQMIYSDRSQGREQA